LAADLGVVIIAAAAGEVTLTVAGIAEMQPNRGAGRSLSTI
jgi:hypothetical protein